MGKRTKSILLVGALLVAFVLAGFWLRPFILFASMQAESLVHAGTWEDDPQNWYRAFREQQPAGVKIIHSKYWRSNHFTYEFVYYFEVDAVPEWKETFLKNRGLIGVAGSAARSFRDNVHSDDTPAWFVPDAVNQYEVWDRTGYPGSVWINKTNGHIFFYDMQL